MSESAGAHHPIGRLFDTPMEPTLVIEGRSVRLGRAGKRGWFGKLAGRLRVLVDEVRIGALGYGDEMKIDLDSGVHLIRVQWPKWQAVGFLVGRFVNFTSAPVEARASQDGDISRCCGVTDIGYERAGGGGGRVGDLQIWEC